jgi:Holliday junction resolvasome RuvABC endonuclease subunit
MLSLGIDVATRSGWALVERVAGKERLLDHGILNLARGPREQIERLASMHARRADLVALELGYLDKNVATLMVLCRFVGRFEQACEAMGKHPQLIQATVWQRSLLRGLAGPMAKREELKRAAVMWARATFREVLGEDEADASAIATHVLRTTAMAERIARAS